MSDERGWHRLTLDGRIGLGSIAAVLQVLVFVLGGLYAVAKVEAAVDGIRDQVRDIKLQMQSGFVDLRSDLNQRTSEFERRTDQITDRIDRLKDSATRTVRP